MQDVNALEEEIRALEETLGGASGMARAFESELKAMQGTLASTSREVNVLSGGISRGLRRAFDGLVFDGMRLEDALKGVAQAMIDAAYSAAIRPVTDHFSGLLAGGIEAVISGFGLFAQGGSFAQGRVMPFAQGGVVSGPTPFPMRGGAGLMGEAGPEAIMPLKRGADGKLGVAVQGGAAARPVQVVMNISTPDVEGFRRGQTQIAASMTRLLSRGQRNR
ncbi:MAG: phage tail tape measure protein [Alphaproteobacteria bacterium]|nr:MAG: phage tail tape measure protein [Alphaproteobacteria bacterium]